MKKKLFILLALACIIMCLFAISVSAAEPDESKGVATLSDGTKWALWDKDGNGLIWYISGTETVDNGDGTTTTKNVYSYVSVADTTAEAGKASISFPCTWTSGTKYQLGSLVITDANGNTFDKKTVVVANLEGAILTSGGASGKPVNCFAESFTSNTNLKYVKLPAATKGLYKNVFSGCTSLEYVNISELTELENLGSGTFHSTTSLSIPADFSNSKLVDIGSACFEKSAITALVFPTGGTFTTIGHYALQGIPYVTEIHIPNSVTSIGMDNNKNSHTFKGCTSLEKVTGFASLFERKVLTFIPGYMFVNCGALEELDMPTDGYTAIYGGAFQYCDNLFSNFDLVIPETCTSIGSVAFEKTNIVTVRLNGSYTTIYSNTFRDCSNLSTIYMTPTASIIQGEAFRGIASNTTIFFVGTQGEANTLKTNVSGSLNNCGANYNDAIVNATVISLADYNALETKTGRYLVYGVNKCDAFYDGKHTLTGTDCTKDDSCNKCSLPMSAKATHEKVETLVYKSFLSNGTYTCTCAVLGCTAIDVTVEDEASVKLPIFIAGEGFSTRDGVYGIAGGYSVNLTELGEYNRINKDNPITFGIMLINPNYLGGKTSFIDSNGLVNADGGFLQVDMSNTEYSNVSVSITGFDNAQDLSLVIALYAYTDPENVEYIQSQTTKCASEKVTLGGVSLYTVTYESVLNANSDVGNLGEFVIPTNKEQE